VSWVTLLLAVISVLIGSFVFTIQDPYWQRLGTFYSILGVLALICIFIAVTISDSRVTNVGNPLGVLLGFALGIGVLAGLKPESVTARITDISDYVRTFEVALTEELLFRLALPLFFYLFFNHTTKTPRGSIKNLISAILISNLFFAWFHSVAYGLDLMNILIAFVAGTVQSISLMWCSSRFGASAFVGVVGGHFAWNLSITSELWLEVSFAYLFFTTLVMTLIWLRSR